jgi:hypothetical protein
MLRLGSTRVNESTEYRCQATPRKTPPEVARRVADCWNRDRQARGPVCALIAGVDADRRLSGADPGVRRPWRVHTSARPRGPERTLETQGTCDPPRFGGPCPPRARTRGFRDSEASLRRHTRLAADPRPPPSRTHAAQLHEPQPRALAPGARAHTRTGSTPPRPPTTALEQWLWAAPSAGICPRIQRPPTRRSRSAFVVGRSSPQRTPRCCSDGSPGLVLPPPDWASRRWETRSWRTCMRGFCVWLVSTRTSLLACSHPRSLLPRPGLTSERRSWRSSARADQRKPC